MAGRITAAEAKTKNGLPTELLKDWDRTVEKFRKNRRTTDAKNHN